MTLTPDELDRRRAERNADLLERMRWGDPGMHVSSEDTNFPPRPQVQKDWREVLRTLGRDDVQCDGCWRSFPTRSYKLDPDGLHLCRDCRAGVPP